MAPEVLDGNYDTKVDIWSLGVLLYVFMSGYLPFQGDNRNDVFYKIQNAKYHFNDCSEEVKDLIRKMLVIDPKKRLSAGEALKHKWFTVTTDNVIQINAQVLHRLKSFRGVSKLKKAAMNMLVKMAD
jgi:calcium-dependent protein kinase